MPIETYEELFQAPDPDRVERALIPTRSTIVEQIGSHATADYAQYALDKLHRNSNGPHSKNWFRHPGTRDAVRNLLLKVKQITSRNVSNENDAN